MIKIPTTCCALILPLTLVWACGSSGDGSGDNGTGARSATQGLGGSNVLIMGEAGQPSTGGTTNNSGGTTIGSSGGSLASDLCDGDCICSNGLDDDDDGLVDGLDPECTGPFDDDEGSFATGIPGDNRDPKWQDCFFDGNSGAGDDDCRYHTDCLTGDKEADDPDCSLTEACVDFCAPRTPNGCDCFGCCSVTLDDGSTTDILTGSDCSVDQAGDAKACPPCVKSEACDNTCGRCELCPGKTVEDLPDDCTPDPGVGGAPSTPDPGYTCDDGEQVCGPDLDPCPLGRYCSLGCCLLAEPK